MRFLKHTFMIAACAMLYCGLTLAQQPAIAKADNPNGISAAEKPATTTAKPVEIESDDAVAILKMQRDRASVVINLQQLAAQFEKGVKDREELDKAIGAWIVEKAREL